MSALSKIHHLQIGHRIYALVIMLLLFIGIIGGVGIYKMQRIGDEMEEIAKGDIPLTRVLEKITIQQLEQAILMEKALRLRGVMTSSKDDTFETVASNFETLSKQTEKEILEAENMVAGMLAQAVSEEYSQEYGHILNELKAIEKEHKDYEDHVVEVFAALEGENAAYDSSPDVITHNDPEKAKIDQLVIQIDAEQKKLNKHVEALLYEVSGFTEASMNRALENEKLGKKLITILSVSVFILGMVLAYILSRSVTAPLGNLTDAMTALADDKLDTEIPSSRFKDEVDQMAQAMKVFQANMQRARQLEKEQAAIKKKQQQRHNELNQLVGIFGATIGAVFEQIQTSSNGMVSNAENMLNQSQQTQQKPRNHPRMRKAWPLRLKKWLHPLRKFHTKLQNLQKSQKRLLVFRAHPEEKLNSYGVFQMKLVKLYH